MMPSFTTYMPTQSPSWVSVFAFHPVFGAPLTVSGNAISEMRSVLSFSELMA